MTAGRIRSGMGGWNYEPWHETFYPADVSKARELSYASRAVTAIEINGTFYRLQKPDVFRKWHDDTPDDFMFTVKAPRYIVQRKLLMEAEAFLPRFIGSGLSQLKSKLGPILWQLPPTTHFNAADLDAFMKLLPREVDGRRIRHVLEPRHASFCTPAFIALLRRFGSASVFAEHESYPAIADVTGDFVYARLQKGEDDIPTAYPPKALDAWAGRLRAWADGGAPADLPRVDSGHKPAAMPRDVFAYVIHEGKIRAPAAAMALIELARRHNVAIVFADTDEHPSIADVTGDFVYGRLMRTLKTEPTGYSRAALAAWAERAKAWANGSEPTDLPVIQAERAPSQPRDVFLFFISGAKERAPLAAQHLLSLLGHKPSVEPRPITTPAPAEADEPPESPAPKKPPQPRAKKSG